MMGLARWTFGEAKEASACFERASAHVDAALSVWHQPIMHQFAARSACTARDGERSAQGRAKLRAWAEAGRDASSGSSRRSARSTSRTA